MKTKAKRLQTEEKMWTVNMPSGASFNGVPIWAIGSIIQRLKERGFLVEINKRSRVVQVY